MCSKYDLSQKHQLTTRIRDELATLKWEIWENIGVQKRSTLSENEFEKIFAKNYGANRKWVHNRRN